MPENIQDEHSREQIWQAVRRTDDRVSSMEAAVASQGATLSGIEAALGRIESRDSKPTNLLGIGMFALGLIAALGSFTVLHTSPIAKDVEAEKDRFEKFIALYLDDRDEHYLQMSSDAQQNGKLQADVQALQKVDDRLVDETIEIIKLTSKQEGQIEMLTSWVNKVDNMGSRVHIRPSWEE